MTDSSGPASPTPRTLAEFKAALISAGKSPDIIGWEDDREARRDEGSMLLRLHPDGRCDIITLGRGDHWTETFDSEASAIASIAPARLHPDIEVVPPEELAALRAATQRRAKETLARINAAQQKGRP